MRYSWGTSSSRRLSSSSRANSVAARLAASWSGRLAPMIGAVTAGLASTQATASVTRSAPAVPASLRMASPVSNSRAEQRVVAGLDTVEAGQPKRLGPADGPHQLIGQEVRAADVAHLALVHEVIEGAQGLVDRRGPVVPVQLVQVDVVGLQAPQRGLD